VMRFYRQRPMPFANLSKSIPPGNPTGKSDGSAQDTCFPSWRAGTTRRRCGCASNSSCGLVTNRTVALPLIERANDVSTAINAAVLGGRSRHVHVGRTGADRAGGRDFCQAIDTTERRRFAVNRLQILDWPISMKPLIVVLRKMMGPAPIGRAQLATRRGLVAVGASRLVTRR
jgi:hypothetical protein